MLLRHDVAACYRIAVVASTIVGGVAASLAGTLSTLPGQKMITLTGEDAGGAACLDGSPYAFYIVPGSSDSFSIGLHGGGWCYDEIDCLERSKNALGTSTLWNETECYGPPAFNCYGMKNCTMVFLPYCDGSSFTSHREETWPVANSTTKLTFRGRRNLIRTLDILQRDYGLGNAKDVVLSGGSAGGLSTYLGLDYVAERLPNASVVGMPVAGYFLDHEPAPFAGPVNPYSPPYEHVAKPYNSYPEAIKYMYSMHNSSAQLSQECEAHYGPVGEAWKCLMAPHAQSFVKTPFFAIQSRFDEFQLGPGIGRVPCILGQTYAPPYKTDSTHICNATERDYIVQYGADFMGQFAPVLNSDKNGCFLVSCIQHGINAAIGNITNGAAFQAWHTKAALGKEHGYHFVDDCAKGGSTPCNLGAGCSPPRIFSNSETAVVHVHVNASNLLFRTSPRFVSWNIDASPNRGFQWRNLSSPNLLALAKGLPDGYLRFGGSGNDALWYGDGIGAQSCTDGAARKFQCMNATMTDALIALAVAARAELVFGLNMENFYDNRVNPGPGWQWNSTNAEAMVQYLAARGQPYAFELGNEENTHCPTNGLSPEEEAQSFARLTAIVRKVYPDATTRPKIIGPDADFMDPIKANHALYKQWYAEFVGNVSSATYDVPLFAATLHEYIDVGWNGSSWLSLDPDKLDQTGAVADEFAATVKGAWRRGTATAAAAATAAPPQIWAGEIGPHNGGSPPCNSSSMRFANFANSFWYMDAMATKAAHGFSVFCRQDFIGADYGLLDCATQTPLPDYYAARLWKQLMGPGVLAATVAPGSPRTVRAYSHCAVDSSDGDIVVLLLNLNDKPVDVDVDVLLPGGVAVGVADRKEWHFTAGEGVKGGLAGTEIKLNGATLEWVLGKPLPAMLGVTATAGSLVHIAPQSIVFVRLEGAAAAACVT